MRRRIIFIALSGALAWAAFPWLSLAAYAVRLSMMPAPVSLPVPVAGVDALSVRDTWQARRGQTRRHEGIDIFAALGTPVIASTEGIVLRYEETTLGGKVVWVLGPGGVQHYYAHLQRFGPVRTGLRISPGTVLGFVGNTGNAQATPPHLHYGVYGAAGAINSFPLLKADSR